MSRNDHYVAQAYLRQFQHATSETLIPYHRQRPNIIGKPKATAAVCYEIDGDSNSYFDDPRQLDDYLRPIENKWARNVAELSDDIMYPEQRFGIASYLSYLRSCNPTAKRLGTDLLEASMTAVFDVTVASGRLAAPQLDRTAATQVAEAWKAGKLRVAADPTFAHALAITRLTSIACGMYSSKWVVLANDTDRPFITSDNPTGLLYLDDRQRFPLFFTALTPRLGLVVETDPTKLRKSVAQLADFVPQEDVRAIPKRDFVDQLNATTAKCAESIVLHSESADWVADLVGRHKRWRVESLESRIPTEGGFYVISSQRPVQRDA